MPLLDPPPPRRWTAADALGSARLLPRLWLLISHEGRPKGPTASDYRRFQAFRAAILRAWRLWRTRAYRNVTVQLHLRRHADSGSGHRGRDSQHAGGTQVALSTSRAPGPSRVAADSEVPGAPGRAPAGSPQLAA